jgi:ribonuclease T2
MIWLGRALAAAALLAASSGGAAAQDKPGAFDFYLLSLSWSPTFCARESGARGSKQCSAEPDFGFIVHGLWPQHERGYPENCAAGEAERVPGRLAGAMLDIMPDWGLVQHQWRRHGTCTGLSMAEYFETTRAAWGRVKMPAEFGAVSEARTLSARDIEDAFIAANQGLAANGIAVSCEDGWVEEVRICLTRDLAFRACEEVDRRGCRQRSLKLPPAS